jgi:hypothetical protein
MIMNEQQLTTLCNKMRAGMYTGKTVLRGETLYYQPKPFWLVTMTSKKVELFQFLNVETLEQNSEYLSNCYDDLIVAFEQNERCKFEQFLERSTI